MRVVAVALALLLAACARPSSEPGRVGISLVGGSSDAASSDASDAAKETGTSDGAAAKDGVVDDGARKITGTYTFTVDDSGASTKTGCFTEILPKVR